MLYFPLSGCVRFSPVVKLGRYAAVGMDYVIQVMAVVLLVAEHTQINHYYPPLFFLFFSNFFSIFYFIFYIITRFRA